MDGWILEWGQVISYCCSTDDLDYDQDDGDCSESPFHYLTATSST